jgi:hypothetical protein
LKGFYKDNLSRIAGVDVEIKKEKGYEGNWVAGVKVDARKNKGFFLKRYKGELGSKTTIAIVPRQRRQKCLWTFLNVVTRIVSP